MSYPGGKGNSFHNIISIFPSHRVYVEPFAGNASVFKNKLPSAESLLIEKNFSVYAVLHSSFSSQPGVIVINSDAFDFLKSSIGSISSDTLIYLDPPYLQSTRSKKNIYGSCELSLSEHSFLLFLIKQFPCFVVISGYSNELYDFALSGWNKKSFSSQTRGGPRLESVWYNFSPIHFHDFRYAGHNFTDRQRIKRRLSRLSSMSAAKRNRKLSMMDPSERFLFLSMLPAECSC